MADNASRRGAVEMGTVLMILAFGVIAFFIWWLNGQAEAEHAAQAALVEDTVPEDDLAGVTTVSAADIQMDPSPFEGQDIRLAGLEVQSLLGTQGFWLGLPNGNPFLVSMSPEVMAEGVAVAQGNRATVTGRLYPMNDSTLNAWTEAATIQDNDRIVAEFATHYLEAVQVQVSGGSQGGGAGGDGD